MLKPYGHGMTQTTVAKLENGGRPTRLNEVQALADIFGVPVVDLLAAQERDEMTPNEDDRAMLLRRRMHLEAQIDDVRVKLALADAQAMQLRELLGALSAEHRDIEAAMHGAESLTYSRLVARIPREVLDEWERRRESDGEHQAANDHLDG